MLNAALSKNCRFLYDRDFELLFAAQNILMGEPVHKLCTQVWGSRTLAALARRYPFLFEVCGQLSKRYGTWFWEPLLRFDLPSFSLDAYEAFLLALPREDLIHDALSLDYYPAITRGQVTAALTEDGAAAALLAAVDSEGQTPFLAFQAFLCQLDQLIQDLFAMTRELDTPPFAAALEEAAPGVQAALSDARTALADMDPLEYSQQRMGKTFGNRGPYTDYCFLPSLFLPYRACRFFRPDPHGQAQLLFLSLRPAAAGTKDTVRQLKALADETRFRILALLAQGQVLRGLDIAKRLHLAPSTVSHHMEQLRQAGLLNEETLKDGKYYSLSRTGVESLLAALNSTFGTS